jgi:hypothetical protein
MMDRLPFAPRRAWDDTLLAEEAAASSSQSQSRSMLPAILATYDDLKAKMIAVEGAWHSVVSAAASVATTAVAEG